MNISMDKKYTLKGLPFTVLTVTKPGDYPVVGYTPRGIVYSFKSNGVSTHSNQHLVEVSPYADFVIDEPVMVRDGDKQEWQRKHFAGCSKDGFPQTFYPNGTSWTMKGLNASWNQCRRPTAEELAS